jgi:hypothetical protein
MCGSGARAMLARDCCLTYINFVNCPLAKNGVFRSDSWVKTMKAAMRRTGAFATVFAWLMLLSIAPAAAADLSGPGNAPLNEVKRAILAKTGYDAKSVELQTTSASIIVTVVNSRLADLTEPAPRENEAIVIVRAIADSIADRPEFKAIQAIHIDYVKRQSGDARSEIVDGIDFIKNQRGIFVHHVT